MTRASSARRRLTAALPLAMLALYCLPSAATDLVEAWRAAQQHDLDYTAAHAAQRAGATRRDQASALWRPTVAVTATAGVGANDTAVTGAQFTAPALGTSNGVGFDTSINHGTMGRWAVSASVPLYGRERDAQGRQLGLSADIADLEWQAAQQALILSTAQRYFDLVLAGESLRVLRRQQDAVAQALTEMRERFRVGDVPITDTQEAAARSEGIAAQVLALQADLQLKQAAFADATGLTEPADRLLAPVGPVQPVDDPGLDVWMAASASNNPQLRIQMTAVEVARQEAARSRGALSPSVDLVAQAARDRLGGTGDYGNAGSTASNRMIGVQLTLPLYTGGMRSAREQEALRGIEKAQALAERARQQLAQQTRSAWLGLTVGGGRIAALQQALTSTQSRLESTRLGRKVGDRTTLDLLNAENDAASAELTLLQARIDWLMDRLRLAAAAGQLDELSLQKVNLALSRGSVR